MIDQTVSHYKILEKLGEGGMGVVYKAEDQRLKRPVALKFLPPHLTGDREAMDRFVMEAQAASALDHQNICTIYQIDESNDGRKFISMAYYDGATLKAAIADGPLPLDRAIDIAIQIAQGLAKAHEKGIVHRDIKPGNIIIRADGTVKIIDFGLSKLLGGQDLTQTGTTKGTVAYMAPEQALGKVVDHRADIWALGVVLYEMLCGQKPFQGEQDLAVLYSIVNEEPVPLKSVGMDAPPAVQQVLDRLLAKSPAERYGNMADVLHDLQHLQQSGEPPSITYSRYKEKNFTKSRFGILAAALLTLITALVIITASKYSGSSTPVATTDANLIAVMPFTIHGGDKVAFLREGMMDLLSIKFDGAGELRRVDPYVIQNFLTANNINALDAQKGRATAEQLKASKYILGNVYELGDKIQMTAGLYDTRTGLLQSAETRSMNASEIYALVDELARKLLLTQLSGAENHLQRLESVSSASSAALKFYLEGEALLRSGKYDAAVEAYKKAVQEDSTFALASYRIAYASSFEARYSDERKPALNNALKHMDKLSRRDKMLLEALNTKHDHRANEAIQQYRAILNSYPEEFEAWFMLGTVMQNFGARLGKTPQEINAPIMQAYRMKPNDPIVIGFAQLSHMLDRDFENLISFTRNRLANEPGGTWENQNASIIAFWENDETAQLEILKKLDKSYSIEVMFSGWCVMIYENFEGAKQIFQLLLAQHRSDFEKGVGYRSLALVYFAQGQFDAAFQQLQLAENYDPVAAQLERARMFMTPYVSRSENTIRSFLQKSAALDTTKKYSQMVRLYTTGALELAQNKPDNAEKFAKALNRLSDNWQGDDRNSARAAFAADLSHSLQAGIAWHGARAGETLAALDAIRLEGWWTPIAGNQTHSQGYERYLRALALVELERYDEALEWLSTLGYATIPGITYRVPKHILTGELYEKMGQPQKAIEHYQLVIKLWENCDPALKPVVADIQQRIERLSN